MLCLWWYMKLDISKFMIYFVWMKYCYNFNFNFYFFNDISLGVYYDGDGNICLDLVGLIFYFMLL